MSDNPLDSIKDRLNEAMADVHRIRGRRLSNTELGDAIGLSDSTVGAWLNGNNKPKLENMLPLARALGVRAGWLAFGEEPRYAEEATRINQPPPLRPEPDDDIGRARSPLF